MVWVSVEEILAIHDYCIHTDFGKGVAGQRTNVDGVLLAIKQYIHYENITNINYALAVFFERMVNAHAFIDGNKRTALASLVFLAHKNNKNETNLIVENKKQEILFNLTIDVATKKLALAKIAKTIQDMFI